MSSHFEVTGTKEFKKHIEIRLEELAEFIPDGLKKATGKIFLDGFCNSIELQSFPLKGKAVYLKLYRRRWKVSGEKQFRSSRCSHGISKHDVLDLQSSINDQLIQIGFSLLDKNHKYYVLAILKIIKQSVLLTF